MKIRFVFAFVFLALFSALGIAANDIISAVAVEGLENVKLKRVLSAVSLKKGKYYSSVQVKDDVRSILALGEFENVEVHFDNNDRKLTFVVTEKPYVKCVVFKGNSAFSAAKLKDVSTLKEKEFYDPAKLEETKNKVIALYHDKGYADFRIETYPTVDANTNIMTLTFLITENNKIVIGEVQIDGTTAVKNRKILKIMKTAPKKIFKENVFQSDLKSIETFYKDNGFMDYEFIGSTISYNDNRTKMFLKLNINEGMKYEFRYITHTGNSVVSDKEIKKIIKIKKGQVFNQQKIIETVQRIYGIYSDRGYLHAVISPVFNKEDGIVDVNLSIKENSVVYVGDVYIDGLVFTRDKVIRREILLKPGDVLSASKVRRSIEKIYNLGFIESVDPQMLFTGLPGVMNLSFSVNEGSPGMFTAGVGYSSIDEFIASIQIQHANIFGLSQKVNLLGEFGSKRQNYQFEWADPWLFNKNISLTLSVFDINRKRDYADTNEAYEEHKSGSSAKLGHRFGDCTFLSLTYKYEHVGYSNFKDNEIKARILGDDGDIDLKKRDDVVSISPQVIYNSLDYVFDPSRGNKQVANLEVANTLLGGKVNFVKGIFKSTWFFPTFWRFVFSVNMELGAIDTQTKVPINEKFYVGGADSIRGYKYRTEIGPKQGGKVKGVMNLEYKFPIISEKRRSIIQGVLFYDIGGAWEDYRKIDFNVGTNPTNLRSGVGFGIRIVTPVFPIRFDWGCGLNHRSGERLDQFYINFGTVF